MGNALYKILDLHLSSVPLLPKPSISALFILKGRTKLWTRYGRIRVVRYKTKYCDVSPAVIICYQYRFELKFCNMHQSE